MTIHEARRPGDEPEPDGHDDGTSALFAEIPAYDVVDGELLPREPRRR